MIPTQPDAHLLPEPAPVKADGRTHAGIRYLRPAGVDIPTDILYLVERSTDLDHWTSSGLKQEIHRIDGRDLEQVEARCVEDFGKRGPATVFLRVVVKFKGASTHGGEVEE